MIWHLVPIDMKPLEKSLYTQLWYFGDIIYLGDTVKLSKGCVVREILPRNGPMNVAEFLKSMQPLKEDLEGVVASLSGQDGHEYKIESNGKTYSCRRNNLRLLNRTTGNELIKKRLQKIMQEEIDGWDYPIGRGIPHGGCYGAD